MLTKRARVLGKWTLGFFIGNVLIANAYVLYRYIDIEVNVMRPRVSEYLLNRFK